MKPIIGLTMEPTFEPENERSRGVLKLNWNYPEVIANAGGVPFLIPPMADMSVVAQVIHGWLIPGGLDIDASRFGEANHDAAELQDPSRYDGEFALLNSVPSDLPILGICYGCQFLNVANGGTLEQHLPDRVGHTEHTGGTWEANAIAPGSKLAEFARADEIKGRSYHHQAVSKLAEGFVVTSRAKDGTVEAIEVPDHSFRIGVQWHPERSLSDHANGLLIERFVEAARAFALGKVGAR